MRTSTATIPRLVALVAQFLTFCGFVIIMAGLAKIQRDTDKLGTINADTTAIYTETFQSALLSPYPTSHHFQFSFIWFIIFYEFFLLTLTLGLTLMPAFLAIGRSATFTLLAVAMTLVILVINNLTYFHRSDAAKTLYSSKSINCTYAGALIIIIGNAFTVIGLGAWTPEATATATAYPSATTAKREAEVTAV